MAYSATVTGPTRYTMTSGRTAWVVRVSELECAATSECMISGLPGLVHLQKIAQFKVSGTATTSQPTFSKVPAATNAYRTSDGGYKFGSAQTFGSSGWENQPATVGATVETNGGALYMTTGINGGSSDNAVLTWLVFEEGTPL